MTDRMVVGVDMGGTRTRAGLADESGEIGALAAEPTPFPSTATAAVDHVQRIVGRLLAEARKPQVQGVVVGVPAACDPRTTRLRRADNLPALNGAPFARLLTERLGCPVAVENDVNLAAVGELHRGCAQGVQEFAFVAVGTGLGLGLISQGRLLRGATGAAGEVAYLPIGADPSLAEVRERGALTTVASGPRVQALAETLRPSYPESRVPEDAPPSRIFALAKESDPLAAEILRREARWLAEAILSIIAVVDPQLVVLGGGVGSLPALLEPTQRALAEMLPDPPPVRTSVLGDLAGVYGGVSTALALPRREL